MEKSRGDTKELIYDMIYSLHRFGSSYNEYFLFEFYHKNALGRSKYITDKLRWQYYEILNNRNNIEIFNNKYETYKTFSCFYKRTCVPIISENDRNKFINFVEKHQTFIIKPLSACCGEGIEKVFVKVNNANSYFDFLISKGSFIAEEIIRQSKEMSELHFESVNTIRVPAILNKGKAEIISPVLRVGIGNSIVDNAGANGMMAGIDLSTGVVCTHGYTKNGQTFEIHPDSKVSFIGFQIPDWEDAKSLIDTLVNIVDGNRYYAWDIAHSVDGWVVVECNENGELYLSQTCNRRGLKDQFHELMTEDELNLLN